MSHDAEHIPFRGKRSCMP